MHRKCYSIFSLFQFNFHSIDNFLLRSCLNIAQCVIGIGLRFYILVWSVSGAVFFFVQFYNFTIFVQFLFGRCKLCFYFFFCLFLCFTLFLRISHRQSVLNWQSSFSEATHLAQFDAYKPETLVSQVLVTNWFY